MIMMMVLSTFLDLLLRLIYEMRELAQISFVREILQSYLLHPMLVQGLAGVLANIILPNGCVVLTESWNV